MIEAMSHIGMRLQARQRRDGCPMPAGLPRAQPYPEYCPVYAAGVGAV